MFGIWQEIGNFLLGPLNAFPETSLKVAKLQMASNAVVIVVAAREPENEKSFTLQTGICKVLYIR